MTKKQKQKWIEALLRGDYEQGRAYLQMDGKYCCLGVARAIGLCKQHKSDDLVSPRFLPHKIQKELATLNDIGIHFDMIAGLIDVALEPTCIS